MDDEDEEKSNDQIIPQYKLSGKSILIKPPSQANIPDQTASIKEAIKGKQLNAKQLEEFNKLVDSEDPFCYKQKDTMKTLYKDVLYDRARKVKGGGRHQAIYINKLNSVILLVFRIMIRNFSRCSTHR